MNAAEIFNDLLPKKLATLPALFSAGSLQGKSVALDVEGEGGGQWSLAINQQGIALVQPGIVAGANCIIRLKDSTFEGLLRGTVNVPMAVLTRKIKIEGEKSVAATFGLALQKLFS